MKSKSRENASLRLPQIALHVGVSRLGSPIPALRLRRLAEQQRKVLHVPLVAIKQAVQADRRIVMGGPVRTAPKRKLGSKPDSRIARSPR